MNYYNSDDDDDDEDGNDGDDVDSNIHSVIRRFTRIFTRNARKRVSIKRVTFAYLASLSHERSNDPSDLFAVSLLLDVFFIRAL